MEVDPTQVTRIYWGQDNWCRCGCAGEYTDREEGKLFDSRLARFMKMLSTYSPRESDVGLNYRNISYGKDRALTVYFD